MGLGHPEVLAMKEIVHTQTAENTRCEGGRQTRSDPSAERFEQGHKIPTGCDPRFEINVHGSTLREIHDQIDKRGRGDKDICHAE